MLSLRGDGPRTGRVGAPEAGRKGAGRMRRQARPGALVAVAVGVVAALAGGGVLRDAAAVAWTAGALGAAALAGVLLLRRREAVHAAPAEPSAVPGTPFGPFVLLDLLGEGGMGEVFRAVERAPRRVCVVKRLRAELADRPDSVTQFLDEARLGAALVHPNLVGVYGHGEVGGQPYIAQEYVAGRDLDLVVRRSLEVDRQPLPPDVVLHVAREALQALAYAHTRTGPSGAPLGLVHRDVSPNNLLLSWGGAVKLFDFGIVKAQGRATRTQYGVVKGNVVFMAPEQACGDVLDGRADLFSLGLVLFYALTGTYLYAQGNTIQLLTHAAGGPSREEQARVAALPAPFGAAVARVLQRERDARFADAAAFLAALPPAPGGAETTAALVSRLFEREVREEAAALSEALTARR